MSGNKATPPKRSPSLGGDFAASKSSSQPYLRIVPSYVGTVPVTPRKPRNKAATKAPPTLVSSRVNAPNKSYIGASELMSFVIENTDNRGLVNADQLVAMIHGSSHVKSIADRLSELHKQSDSVDLEIEACQVRIISLRNRVLADPQNDQLRHSLKEASDAQRALCELSANLIEQRTVARIVEFSEGDPSRRALADEWIKHVTSK